MPSIWRPASSKRACALPAPTFRPLPVEPVAALEGESSRRHRVARTRRSVRCRRVRGFAVDQGDRGAPSIQEVLHRELAGQVVVGCERRVRVVVGRRVRVHHGHWNALADRRAWVGGATENHDAVNAASEQGSQVMLFPDRVAARIAQQDRRGARAERVLGSEQHGQHEAVVEIAREHADGAGALVVERAREGIGGEAQLLSGREHPLASLRLHLVAAIERLRRGGRRHASQTRNIG